MDELLLSVKEVSKLVEMSIASVNYYSNLGLFEPVERRGNRRLYNKQGIIIRFEMIKKMRKQGYSLGLIQQKLHGGA